MSHWPESWKSLDWKFPPRGILTECRKLLESTMYSMGRTLRRASLNQDRVVAVAAVAAVSTLENPPNQLERAEKFHCPLTSVREKIKTSERSTL